MVFNIDFAHLGVYRESIIRFKASIPKGLLQVGSIFYINKDCALNVVDIKDDVVYIKVEGSLV